MKKQRHHTPKRDISTGPLPRWKLNWSLFSDHVPDTVSDGFLASIYFSGLDQQISVSFSAVKNEWLTRETVQITGTLSTPTATYFIEESCASTADRDTVFARIKRDCERIVAAYIIKEVMTDVPPPNYRIPDYFRKQS